MRGCSKAPWVFIFGLALVGSVQAVAGPAVLIEDDRRDRRMDRIESDVQAEPEWNRPESSEGSRFPASTPSSGENQGTESEERPLRERNFSRRPPRIQSTEKWSSLAELRARRRVGVGASFLGRAGFIGLDAELNLHPQHSLIASIGGGPGYDGASVGYKWTIFDGSWHPTMSFALAGWSADDLRLNHESAIPAFFRPNPGQPASDPVRQIYFIPGVGLQTLQLAGDGVGGMIFVEVLLFTELPTFAVSPTGSVGAKYFF